MKKTRIKWGQTVLEVCLTVMVTILLLLGVVNTWTYYTKTLTERMDEYKATRLAAADILGSKPGKRIQYQPEKFDILKGSSIGQPIAFESIPNYTEFCDIDSYGNAQDLYRTLSNETNFYSNLSNNATSDEYAYRAKLASLVPYRAMITSYEPNGFWESDQQQSIPKLLYGTNDNIRRIFSDSWNSIESQMDSAVNRYYSSYCSPVSECKNVAFGVYTTSSQFTSPAELNDLYCWNNCYNPVICSRYSTCFEIVGNIRNRIINPGIEAEKRKLATTSKKNIMEELTNLTDKYSKGYITPCAWRSVTGKEDECDPKCSYLLQNVNSTIRRARDCVKSASNNNVVEVDNCRNNYLFPARNSLADYENCYQANCGRSPWAPWEDQEEQQCYVNNCKGFEDQANHYRDLAQQAFSNGQMDNYNRYSNLSLNMTYKFSECMKECSKL